MNKFATYLCLSVVVALVASPAWSISITNQDGEVRRITITMNGERSEQDISVNETVELCEQGCFITFPDGTLTAYQGDEKIGIRNGGPALLK
jgi:hypothetical protein